MTRCTHGADCLVHPDANALHDYTPSAADALHTVLDATRGPVPFVVEADVRRIADQLGITLER